MIKKTILTKEEKIEILNQNVDIIYKFCHKNKNQYIKDFENFSDFISNCIILAYDNIDKWDCNRSALSTYIYNTLPWQLFNQKHRDKSIRAESLDEILENNPDVEMYDEVQLYNEDRAEDEKILAVVEPMLHDYTKKYFYERKTYQQIADEKGVSLSTVKNIIYKNLKEIREKVVEK